MTEVSRCLALSVNSMSQLCAGCGGCLPIACWGFGRAGALAARLRTPGLALRCSGSDPAAAGVVHMAQSACGPPAVLGTLLDEWTRQFPGLRRFSGQHGRPRAGRIHSDRTGRLAVADGAIVRIRRGHLALPRSAAPDLVARGAGQGLLTLCVRCADLRLVDAAPRPRELHLCVGTGAAAGLCRTWPVPASPAPVAPCGRAGRHPAPRAALPAGTGGARHGPVCRWPRATSAGLPPGQAPGKPQRPRRSGAGPGRFPGRTRCWKFSPTPSSCGRGCTCAGMSRSPGWGRWTSLLRTA